MVLISPSFDAAECHDAALAAAQSHFRQGHYDKVVALLNLDRQAADPPADAERSAKLQILGHALNRLGKPLEASDAIEQASLLCPISPESRILLASCYGQLRRSDLARELYLQLAIRRDLAPTLMRSIARGLAELGEYGSAAQVCTWALGRASHDAALHFDMSAYLSRLGEPSYRVEALIGKAGELEPDDAHYRAALAAMQIHMHRPHEATLILKSFGIDQLRSIPCPHCLRLLTHHFERLETPSLAAICREAGSNFAPLHVASKVMCPNAGDE